MSINIPGVMQQYFFDLYNRSGRIKRAEFRKIAQFLSHQNKYPTLAARAENLAEYDGLKLEIVARDLMESLFENVVTWTPKDASLHKFGYQVRTEPTLITINGEGQVVIELNNKYDVSHLGKMMGITFPKVDKCPQEWFGTKDIAQLLQAIECKVGIPETMYTGLDTLGNNLE